MALRLALSQIDPCAGDLHGNALLVLDACERAAAAGAQLVLTPELALTGAPLGDLALRRSVVDAAHETLAELATELVRRGLGDLVLLVGHLAETERIDELVPPLPQNCAAVVTGGTVHATYAKQRLLKHGPLDERRVMTRGRKDLVLDVGGARVLVCIGEDLVHENGPVARAAGLGVQLVAALAALPFERDGAAARIALLQRQAEVARAPIAMANLVGGADDLVFDGGSICVAPDGRVLAEAVRFSPDLVIADIDLPVRTAAPVPGGAQIVTVPLPPAPDQPLPPRPLTDRAEGPEEVWAALRLAIRDFADKRGVHRAAVGLSGGADSAVVASLAVDALGAAQVIGVVAPSATTPEQMADDARALARSLGIATREVPIGHEAASLARALGLDDVAAGPVHYRLRSAVLLEIGAAEDALVLATTNKSEFALGAATAHGDAAGDFAPLKDVPRSLVDILARWRNDQAVTAGARPPIPPRSLSRAPSSHSRRQRDDLPPLPPYPVIDPLLELYLDQRASRVELLAAGFAEGDVDAVLRRVDEAEAIRRQTPPGPRLAASPYGRDTRLPIANRWREASPRKEQP